MVSLAVQALAFSVFQNWTDVTRGPLGIPGIPRPSLLGIKFDTMGSLFVFSTFLAGGGFLLSWLLLHSPWGRLLQAVRDDELAARSLGKNARLLRVQVFSIACGMAAVAGCVYASYVSYVDPSLATLDSAILILCMVIVGGLGNLYGPLAGAALLIALPEALRFAQLPNAIAAEARLMAYGLLLIILMHFRPQGLVGSYRMD
jgi:branched-chain amino acid transport system permease protein